MPDRITTIEGWAFKGCSGLTGRLWLPDGLTDIGNRAFDETNIDGFDTTKQEVADLIFGSGVPINKIMVGNQPYQPSTGKGKTFQDKDMEYEILGDDSVKLISYSGNPDGNLIIPDMVSDSSGKSYFVTHIGEFAFIYKNITGTLHLPDTLTSIRAGAFTGCGFTGSLSLPEGLEIIGYSAFQGCSGFSGALNLPEPVTEIGNSAFYGGNGFDSAHLGSNLQKLGRQAFPESLPLYTNSPRVQLLINTYLNQDAIADTSWDGKEDVPAGAVASVKQDTVITGDKRIGDEAVITVPDGITLTVDGNLTVDGSLAVDGTIILNGRITVNGNLMVDGTIFVEGTLIINGAISGSGVLIIGKNGKVEGNLSGFRVEYQEDRDDLLEAKKLIESYTYIVEQGNAGSEGAVQNWLLETIKEIPGLSDTGAAVGEVKITGFTPATEGTSGIPNGLDGSFSFTLLLSKGNSGNSAGGAGTITAYISRRSSSGRDKGSTTINPDILRGTWERMENGIWKFRQTTGIYAAGRWGIVDNLWYYFDGEGRMLTGWQLINNQWYYLCTEEDTKTKPGLKEGAMATGWHYDLTYQRWFYLSSDGAMAVGWKEIDGKRYYFNPESDGTRGVLQKEEPL